MSHLPGVLALPYGVFTGSGNELAGEAAGLMQIIEITGLGVRGPPLSRCAAKTRRLSSFSSP
jgi:hypothetical protein